MSSYQERFEYYRTMGYDHREAHEYAEADVKRGPVDAMAELLKMSHIRFP